MPRIVKCGLIQAKNACATDESIDKIKQDNIEKSVQFIEEAAKRGVQIICMQEVFTTPYFCAEQNTHWYGSVEKIPDGPTGGLRQGVAAPHASVTVVRLGGKYPRRPDGALDAGGRPPTRHGDCRADLRRRNYWRLLQHGGGD